MFLLGNTKWPRFSWRQQPHQRLFQQRVGVGSRFLPKETAGTALSIQSDHFSPARPAAPSPPRCTAAAGVAPGRTLHTTRPGPVPQPPLTFPQRPRLRLQPPVTLGARFYSFTHRLRGGRMPPGQPGWGGSPRGGDGRGTAPPAGAGARR